MRRGAEAAQEFEKILSHRPIYQNSARAALSQLGLARSFADKGDSTKARAAYDTLFAIWKTADFDLPILKQAPAEYAALR